MRIRLVFTFLIFSFYGWSFADGKFSNSGFTLYGFVRPSYSFATDSVSSFGYPSTVAGVQVWNRDNQVAATEASPGLGVAYVHTGRSSFVVGQSRFGLRVRKDMILGVGEIDLVDFDQAEATTTIHPRLRVVGASVTLSKRLLLFAGQDWDIVTAAKPFVYNLVGFYFRSGNSGFMRPQVRLEVADQDRKEVFAAMVGSAGLNSNSNASGLERGVFPVAGFRYTPIRLKNFTGGVAGVGTTLRFESASGQYKRRPAFLAKLFSCWKLDERVEIRTNVFGGTNSQSTGAVNTISTGSYSASQSELGGLLTVKYTGFSRLELIGGTGVDQILAGSEKRDGELIRNWSCRLGLGWNILESTKWFSELTYFHSKYRWTSSRDVLNNALQFESGLHVDI